MAKPQTFDIFAVSIPDSNVQMAVARIMVGADRYLSMQDALEKVKTPPVLLFKGTELRAAEERISKLKALGVGFRVVKADDGTEDDSIMRDDELPGGAPPAAAAKDAKDAKDKPPSEAALSDILNPNGASGGMPPLMSIQDVISHRRGGRRNAQAGADANTSAGGGKNTEGFTGFGSASGHGGGGGGSGIRAGVGMLGELKKSEEASRRRNRLVSIIAAAVVVIAALLFVVAHKDKKFRVKQIRIEAIAGANGIKRDAANKPKGNKDGAEGSGAPADGGAPEQPFGKPMPAPERRFDMNEKPRSDINKRQRQLANSYIDSAKAGGAPLEKRVNFYKIAISFNRYNLQAWHGLLQTYREMNDAESARATEAQMKEIFGEGVSSVNAAVAQFGEIVDAYANESGVYLVEYKTKKTTEDEIKREVFNMTRSVRTSCKCRNISIHASTSTGGGLTANSTAETSVHTLKDFLSQAEIRWVD